MNAVESSPNNPFQFVQHEAHKMEVNKLKPYNPNPIGKVVNAEVDSLDWHFKTVPIKHFSGSVATSGLSYRTMQTAM